jgi:hypothetical protein
MLPPTSPRGVFALLLVVLPLLGPTAPTARAENIVYPPASGIVDVTAAPYFADPTGTTDSTAALQAALDANPNGNRIIYLPHGTYRLTDTLSWPAGTPGASDFKRTILQGQSRAGSILRLADHSPAFQDTSGSARPVVFTGRSPAQRFRNAVRNLTIHTGSGNPNASGLQFNASNQGTVDTVKIISGDGQGRHGLDLAFTGEIGPLLVRDLHVVGFDYGVRTADVINGLTFDTLRVEQSRLAGLQNDGQMMAIHGYHYQGDAPAIINGSASTGIAPGGSLVLLEATLVGTGPAAAAAPAITNRAALYVRDVSATGFGSPLLNLRGGSPAPASAPVGEWFSEPALRQFPAPAVSLQLPIARPPTIPWDEDPAAWANIADYGAAHGIDSTAAFQAAIDSGKTTVLIPAGATYTVNGTVRVRGNVRRITGTEGRLGGSGRIIIEDGAAPAVVLERAYLVSGGTLTVQHATSRTFILSNFIGSTFESTGTGDFFLNDVSGGPLRLLSPGQRIWARQLNTERPDVVNVDNHGARLWLLGLKTERGNTKVRTSAGGATEILGAHIYATSSPPKLEPMIEIVDARATVVGLVETNFNGNWFLDLVRETRDGVTETLPRAEGASRGWGFGRALPFYTGRGPLTTYQQAVSDSTLDAPAPTLLDYALATPPGTAAPSLTPSLPHSLLQLTFPRRPDPTLTYAVEASPDLAAWATVWTSTGPANASGPVTVSDDTPLAPGTPRRFLRLRVTPPAETAPAP